MLEGRYFRKVQWGYHPIFQNIDAVTNWGWNLVSLSGTIFSYLNFYINRLVIPFASVTSIIGFMLFLCIAMQLMSGFFLGWYYMPEPGLVIELREEMFNDTRFGAEVFYMHLRGWYNFRIILYPYLKKNLFKKLRQRWVWWVIIRRLCLLLIPLYRRPRNFVKCYSPKWSNLNYYR